VRPYGGRRPPENSKSRHFKVSKNYEILFHVGNDDFYLRATNQHE
jgi:hypothetical protein